MSDIGILAEGNTLQEAFEEGARAALAVMFDLDTIDEVETVEIKAEAPDVELLFVEVLNEVLSIQGVKELALKRIKTTELRENNRFTYKGAAFGEKLNLKKHHVRTEVKGATYSALKHAITGRGTHTLKCILDV